MTSSIDWQKTPAALWQATSCSFHPIKRLDEVSLDDLIAIDEQKRQLLENTHLLLQGKAAEHSLLWGARGTGKSSLVKAIFCHFKAKGLRVIELMREDMVLLPQIVAKIEDQPFKFIVFCDDLVFNKDSKEYRALRTFLQGSIGLPPPNMLIYATTNLRYILPQDMRENQRVTIHNLDPQYSQQTEDSLALADRFGLWLSFYPPSKENYLKKIEDELKKEIAKKDLSALREKALDFARLRATRNYRTAEQFIRKVRAGGINLRSSSDSSSNKG